MKRKFNQLKEIKMFKHHLFNILVIAALVVVTALTVQQGLETTRVVHAADLYGQHNHIVEALSCPMSAVDFSSIRSAYMKQVGLWVSRTNSGLTGVDGGLIQLLSDYRSCSQ